ncbi:E3 ubiquitin-protein ligase TRIM45-like isoform X2 [Haemaphysalis longicornis]
MSLPANNEFKYKASQRPSRLNLQCPACLEKLQDPKALPCLHTLCRRGVERLAGRQRRFPSIRVNSARNRSIPAAGTCSSPTLDPSSAEDAGLRESTKLMHVHAWELGGGAVVICPTCRSESAVTDAQNGLPANALVRRFAPDPLGSRQRCALKQPVARGKRFSLCALCAKSGATVNRCIGDLLSRCTGRRRRQTDTREPHHDRFNRCAEFMLPMAPPGACPLHPTLRMNTSCLTCREAVCSSCRLNKHVDHVSSDFSAAKGKELEQTGVILNTLHSEMAKLEHSVNGTLRKSQALSFNTSQVAREVNSFYDGYVRALESRRRELLDEISSFHTEGQKTLSARSSSLEAALARAKSVHEFGKTLLHFGPAMPEVVLPLVEVLDKGARPLVAMSEKEDVSAPAMLSLKFRKDKGDHRGEYVVYGAVQYQADPSMLSAILSFEDAAHPKRFGSMKAARLKFHDSSGHPVYVEPRQVQAMLTSSKLKSTVPAVVTRATDDPFQLRLEFDAKSSGKHALAVALDDQPVLVMTTNVPCVSRSPSPRIRSSHACGHL